MSTLNVVESIFLTALDKPGPEARAAFLAEACGNDGELRRCVERLLNAHAKADAILPEQAPGLPAAVQPPLIEERAGSVIGPYKLLQQLGEGGFGVVFLAEQEQPVRRKVALKIIKPGMDSKQVIARFEAERQALALMDHPNIARVLDGGTTASGRPYFVMELVKGVPITEFCDQNRLTPRQRLELFIPVCQAVQHAHQKGIIHRDLKPSNVLVTLYDDKPVPKVIDFGVAKAIDQPLTEQTLFTRVGQVIGTLEYMSPEQASLNALDVDTRSDVYALGVLLYELLTGSTPLNKEQLEGVAFMEMLRLIREVEPPRPSTRLSELKGGLPLMASYRKTDAQKLPRLVAGELDWIAMKALDKDRSRRYETASALAADVQRYLKDEPVEARAPSRWYRLRKLARRNQGAVLAGALVAAALVVGTVVSWLFALESGRNAAWALVEKDNAEKYAERAQANEDSAKKEAAQKYKLYLDVQASQENLQHAYYAADMKLIQHEWDADNAGLMFDLLKRRIPDLGQKNLRHFEWHYWNRLLHGAEKIVELKDGKPGQVAEFSPDRRLLAGLIQNKERVVIRLWDTASGKMVKELLGPKRKALSAATVNLVKGQMAFSANGRYLAAVIGFHQVSGLGRVGKSGFPPKPGLGGWSVKGGGGGSGSSSPPELWVWDIETGKDLWHKPMSSSVLDALRMRALTFDLAGEKVAALVKDGGTYKLVVRDAENGEKPQEITVPEELKNNETTCQGLALSPDWDLLLVIGQIGGIKAGGKGSGSAWTKPKTLVIVWDRAAQKELCRIDSPTGGWAEELTYSPNGQQLAIRWSPPGVTNGGSEVWLHDAATGKVLFPCSNHFHSTASGHNTISYTRGRRMQFSPDGKALVVNSNAWVGLSGGAKVWDTATGKLRQKIMFPNHPVSDLTLSADGAWLYLAVGNTVQTWPADRPSSLRVSADTGQTLNGASLSGDGSRLAIGMRQNAGGGFGSPMKYKYGIRVVDTKNRAELLSVKDLAAPLEGFRLSTDGQRVVAHFGPIQDPSPESSSSKIVVWDVDSRKEIGSCPLPSEQAIKDEKTGEVQIELDALSADGQLVAFSYLKSETERVLKVWKVPSGEPVAESAIKDGVLGPVQFSPDNRILVYAQFHGASNRSEKGKKKSDSTVQALFHILDLKDGKELPPVSFPQNYGISRLVFTISADSKSLAIFRAGSSGLSSFLAAYQVLVMDLAGNVKHVLPGHTQPVIDIAFSPDGKRLASLAGQRGSEAKLWDLHNGQEVLTLAEPTLFGIKLQFSADGHRLFLVNRSSDVKGVTAPGFIKGWMVFPYELHTWDATPLPNP